MIFIYQKVSYMFGLFAFLLFSVYKLLMMMKN
jgi:hypothetical protein